MHCNRPYKNEPEMRKDLINRHNSRVHKGDTVYYLGDMAMLGTSQWEHLKGVLNHLNGTKHLIFGNHDEFKWQRYVDVGFSSVHSALWMDIDGFHVVMVHDPSAWCVINSNNAEAITLHGHIHTLYRSIPNARIVNVGVDMWDFYPINFEMIRKELGL
jgi:calcineurin-like phosphoesterase family protein